MSRFSKFFLCLFFFSYTSFSQPTKQNFEDGVILFHLSKTAGTFIKVYLCSFFQSEAYSKTFEPHHDGDLKDIDAITLYTKEDLVSSGHVFLKDLLEYRSSNRPIIVFLRDPFARMESFYRYVIYMVNIKKLNEMVQTFPKFVELDINSFQGVKESYVWNELSRFSPLAKEELLENLNSVRVDECVRYTLENCAFVGDFDHMEDSLHKLNLYLGLSLDVDEIVKTKINETPNAVEKITNPEVIEFFKEQLKWEYMFNERVFAAQRWKYGAPILKKPGERRASMTQYIMPEGFNPDQYLIDMGIEEEVEARVGQDKWKKREAAMQHLIETSKEESKS